MHHEFIETVNRYNLSTFYILPLTGLTIGDFGSTNIIDTYMYPDGTHIVVKIKSLFDCTTLVTNHPAYAGSQLEVESYLLVYGLEEKWEKDVSNYLKGRYSKMSAEAKELIISSCGLPYKTKRQASGQEITDARLLALDKSSILRQKWAELLDIPEDNLPEELMETPQEDWFIDLNIRKI